MAAAAAAAGSKMPAKPDVAPVPNKRKYLLTDPGFLVQYAVALATIGAAMAAAQNSVACTVYITELYDTLQWNLLDAASDMSMVFMMGMLSSSCCLVQILLSAMSLGCAGFNTYLGPVRPVLLALTSALQLYNWQYVLRRGWPINGAIASTSTTAVLALMPEMLECWARRQLRLRAAAAAADDSVDDSTAATLLEFKLAGMGCVSCVKAVSDTLVASDLVAKHQLDFEAEHLKVWVPAGTPDRDLGATSGRVVAALADAGFTATPTCEAAVARSEPACAEPEPAAATTGVPDGRAGQGGGSEVMSWASFVAAGLLSSSCCLLQLGLNGAAMLGIMNVGCAGFNKVLGPYRYELRVATSTWLSLVWLYTATVRPKAVVWRRLALRTVFCGTLMFLPELLQQGMAESSGAIGTTVERVHLDVSGMGCEACEIYVKGVLNSADGVIDSAVSFRDGTAELIVGRGFDFNLTSTLAQLELDGYAATIPLAPCARIWAVNATAGDGIRHGAAMAA